MTPDPELNPVPEPAPQPDPQPDPGVDPELARLHRLYGKSWRIWRTPNWWMANSLVPGVTPTLMEPTPTALEEQLRDPGRAIGQGVISGLEPGQGRSPVPRPRGS